MSAAVGAAARVNDMADAFAATLSGAQLADLIRPHTFANAAAWSNLPEAYLAAGGRPGLRTGTLSPEQWAALDALLAAATGSGLGTGASALHAQLDAEDWLRDHGGGDFYGRGTFTVAFLGAPTASGAWKLQFGGHHLALTNSYINGVLVGATPSFRGIEPFNPSGLQGRRRASSWEKHGALREMLASLDPRRLAAAKLEGFHRDVLLGPGRDWAFPSSTPGIAGRDLTADQADLLVAAIGAFVADVEDEAAARILSIYENELDTTDIAFSGSADLEEVGEYVRIAGESVWIEYSMHSGGVLADPHPHSVWRDRRTDYGGLGNPRSAPRRESPSPRRPTPAERSQHSTDFRSSTQLSESRQPARLALPRSFRK